MLPKYGDDDSEEKEKVMKLKHGQACRHLKAGELDKAEANFKEVLVSAIEEFGELHQRVGAALHNVGIIRLRRGNLGGALHSIEEAVRIRRATHGDFHPKVADSLVEQGIILLSLEHFEESIDIFNEAIELREYEAVETTSKQSKGKINLQIAKILNNIGGVYFEYGDLDNAIETYEEALGIQRDSLRGKDYELKPSFLAMASTICNIGYVSLERNEWEVTIASLNEALAIQQTMLEPGNTQIINTLENLAFAFTKYRNHDKAIEVYKQILQTHARSKCKKNKSVIADIMGKLVYNHMMLCEYEKALKYLKEIERIVENSHEPDTLKLNETRDLIHAAHYEMLKFPGPVELISRCMINGGLRNPLNHTLCRCMCTEPETDEINLQLCMPRRPEVIIKMAGHKISYT